MIASKALATTRLLIVAEDQQRGNDLGNRLRSFGYVVLPSVMSAEAAVAVVTSAHPPDLVLIDPGLDDRGGVDGGAPVEAADRIRDVDGVRVLHLSVAAGRRPSIEDLAATIERVLAEQLAERKKWFSTILKSIRDGVIAIDIRQTVTFLNPVAERLTGWRTHDAAGQPLGDVLQLISRSAGEPLEVDLERVFREGSTLELPPAWIIKAKGKTTASGGEGPAIARDGDGDGDGDCDGDGDSVNSAIDASATPLVTDRGRLLGAIVVLHDVTKRSRAELRAGSARALAAVCMLSGRLAHELNNPLACVLANVDLSVDELTDLSAMLRGVRAALHESENGLALALELEQRFGALLETLIETKAGAARMREVSNHLSRFGQLAPAVDHAALDLNDVVQAAAETASGGPKLIAIERGCRAVPTVFGSARQLEQLVSSLLTKALEASSFAAREGVSITTSADQDGRAMIEIRDCGLGAVLGQDSIMTEEPGIDVDLELTICRTIVLAHGGELRIANRAGAGSTISILFPCSD